jgi:HSP20 family molecular chaperone IbpA
MSTLSQIREGLSRAWDSITEGWRELKEMAAEALTRFHPVPADDEEDVVVTLEVPGMDTNDFDLEVVGDARVQLSPAASARCLRGRGSGRAYRPRAAAPAARGTRRRVR